MVTVNKAPKAGAKGFAMAVTPSREHLQLSIDANGQCAPKDCWHRVAIAAILATWGATSAELSSVKVDAGHIKFRLKGWRYIADTPTHVKRSLMMFDAEMYDNLRIREYSLRVRRASKVQPDTVARLAKKKANCRTWRRENPDYVPPPASLRSRVAGFSSIV